MRQRKKTRSTVQAFHGGGEALWWRREGYAVRCTLAEMMAMGNDEVYVEERAWGEDGQKLWVRKEQTQTVVGNKV